MEKLTASQTLQYLIGILFEYLEELREVGSTDANRFAYGEKSAYTECLEIIQYWKQAEIRGLNFSIEDRFPL